jgi:citronellyl-CoA dehydrogenase
MALAEEWGSITCGGVPMAIGVHTDMATPALARFGSKELRAEFLTPSIKGLRPFVIPTRNKTMMDGAGDIVACLGVSEIESASDVASIKTTAKKVSLLILKRVFDGHHAAAC